MKRHTVIAVLWLAMMICIPFGAAADDVEEIVDVFADYASEAEPVPAAAEPAAEEQAGADTDTAHMEPEPDVEAEEPIGADTEELAVETDVHVDTDAYMESAVETEERADTCTSAGFEPVEGFAGDAYTPEFDVEAVETAAIADTASGWLSFFTARAGYLLVADDRSNIFFTAEFGLFRESGLFISVDAGGGWYHYGGGVNVGYAFPVYGSVKSFVAGGTGGYYNVTLPYNILNVNGDLLWREYGKSTAFCGLFWKATWQNVDFTNRLLFGTKSNLYRYSLAADNFYKQSGRDFNLVYSVGLGYTVTCRKGK